MSSEATRLTRGRLLAAGAAGAGLALGGVMIDRLASDGSDKAQTIAFHGDHQAGIATPAQDRLHFAAFDVTTDDRRELRDLLRVWTDAAARMCAGKPVGQTPADPQAPPDDTGEALGLLPARLTITVGFGPTLFSHSGDDRFGLGKVRPAQLADLPLFAGDELDPDRSGGDLAVQACADDPQVAFHAVRNLTRIGRGAIVMRWSQLGFGRTSSTSRAQDTPRNLMGFKDGTNNIKLEDRAALGEHVWVGLADQPAWMSGGSYLVTRRIRMLIEVWDRASLTDQQATIGRVKESGAPLGGEQEFDKVDFAARDNTGPVVPVDAHIRLAAPADNNGVRILRRGYSFTDGMDTRLGQLDAGLFFISYQRDPRKQFVPLQRHLAGSDALNEYIKHTGSAVFACPPGTRPGGYLGETLL